VDETVRGVSFLSSKKRNRLDHVFQKGRRASGKWVKVWALKEDETIRKKGYGLAVLVRKKAGGAVVRNTLRRRIRAIYASIVGPYRHYWSVVISVKDEACTISYRELYYDLEDLLHKLAVSGGESDRDSRY
jgi:ribonuclease P protein component